MTDYEISLLHQIIGVALRFGEFHNIHSLPSVPVEECPTFEHQGELLAENQLSSI